VDEASRVPDELYFAVRPMLAVSGGALMMLTTPYGKRGIFYEEWTSGHGWARYEVPAVLGQEGEPVLIHLRDEPAMSEASSERTSSTTRTPQFCQ
jgi:hypothetical protein